MTNEQRKALHGLISRLEPQVRKLAEQVVKQDGWMVPTQDKVALPYDEYAQAEISGWSQTDQYGIRWRQQIVDMVQDAFAESELLSGVPALEIALAVVEELEPVFWEAWVNGHKLYEFWKKHQKKARVKA